MPWSLTSLLAWLSPQTQPVALPVLPQLEGGHAPALTLIRTVPETADARLVLRLWATGTEVRNEAGTSQPLLVGSVVEERFYRLYRLLTLSEETHDFGSPLDAVVVALPAAWVVRRPGQAEAPGWDGRVLLGSGPRDTVAKPAHDSGG